MVKKTIKKKPLKPLKFSVLVYKKSKTGKLRISSKSFKGRKSAHKFALKNQCAGNHIKVKLVK
jgi:hypothetical protein